MSSAAAAWCPIWPQCPPLTELAQIPPSSCSWTRARGVRLILQSPRQCVGGRRDRRAARWAAAGDRVGGAAAQNVVAARTRGPAGESTGGVDARPAQSIDPAANAARRDRVELSTADARSTTLVRATGRFRRRVYGRGRGRRLRERSADRSDRSESHSRRRAISITRGVLRCWKRCANMRWNNCRRAARNNRCARDTRSIFSNWPKPPSRIWWDADQAVWLKRLAAEQANFNAALKWAQSAGERRSDRAAAERRVVAFLVDAQSFERRPPLVDLFHRRTSGR